MSLFTPDTPFAEEGAVYLYLRLPAGRAVQAQILHVGATAALGRQIAQDRQSPPASASQLQPISARLAQSVPSARMVCASGSNHTGCPQVQAVLWK